jgi:hypothetical protein
MTPEQAYNELKELYIQTTKDSRVSHIAIRGFAMCFDAWATNNIRLHNWTYRRAESMVNRCRELAPLALQHQP